MIRIATLALGLLGSAMLAGSAVAQCEARLLALATLIRGGDLDAGQRMVEEIEHARDCDPIEKRSGRRSLAEALLLQAKLVKADPQRAAALIEQAAGLKASWEALKDFGDIQTARRDYAGAALTYQQAISVIEEDEDDATLAKIPMKTLKYLTKRADETRYLAAAGEAGTLVSAIPGRDGELGGVYSPIVGRGPIAVHVPVPILFVFDSVVFAPVGQQAATELVTLLKERTPSSVTVIGHADHKGSDAYNQALSEKRAEKVAAYLKLNGVAGTVTALGKGRSEPRVLSEPNDYTPAQIDELNRRVEFDWKP